MPKRDSENPGNPLNRLSLTDLIAFSLVLIAANLLWKLLIHEDEAGILYLCSCPVSAPFNALANHTANAVYAILQPFKATLTLTDGYLAYPNGHSTHIGWSCTSVKQITLFACTILTATPLWNQKSLHKLWYIPLCALLLYGFNILRILLITLAIENHPDWFPLLHTYILKYAFYGIVFLLWMLWIGFFGHPLAQSDRTP